MNEENYKKLFDNVIYEQNKMEKLIKDYNSYEVAQESHYFDPGEIDNLDKDASKIPWHQIRVGTVVHTNLGAMMKISVVYGMTFATSSANSKRYTVRQAEEEYVILSVDVFCNDKFAGRYGIDQ